jgi:serine/threonine protein phosphatase PrpC
VEKNVLALAQEAMLKGGLDNVSIILIRLESPIKQDIENTQCEVKNE